MVEVWYRLGISLKTRDQPPCRVRRSHLSNARSPSGEDLWIGRALWPESVNSTLDENCIKTNGDPRSSMIIISTKWMFHSKSAMVFTCTFYYVLPIWGSQSSYEAIAMKKTYWLSTPCAPASPRSRTAHPRNWSEQHRPTGPHRNGHQGFI